MHNSWVPVALSTNVPNNAVVPGLIGTEAIALWRSKSGQLSVFADRCPHRGMRLSHGFVRGEGLLCIYHGWRYELSGQCIRIPAHPKLVPPSTMRVPVFSVIERAGIIWVSSLDTDNEPPTLIGWFPDRSVTARAYIMDIEMAAGARINKDGVLQPFDGLTNVGILLSEQSDGTTLLHVLIRGNTELNDRINASRSAEVLRRHAEALSAGRPASIE